MPAAVIFPSDPLNPKRVDPHFAAQAEVVREADGQVALIDHDLLLRGEAGPAVRRVRQDLGPSWYRGWMIPSGRYAELESALRDRGCGLLTDAASYRRAHELPGWYETFAEVTPRSAWLELSPGQAVSEVELAGLARAVGSGPGVVKDYVKSRKHEWAQACYVSDVDDADELHAVVGRMLELQGEELAGGVVLCAFERFAEGGEARVWWLDGVPVAAGAHPDTPDLVPETAHSELAPLVAALGPRFVTTDVVRRADGRQRVVEVGDAQVSDLPRTLPPAALMRALVAAA